MAAVSPINQNAVYGLYRYGQVHYDTIDATEPIDAEDISTYTFSYTIPFEAAGFGLSTGFDAMFYVTLNRGARVTQLTSVGIGGAVPP